MDSLIPKKRWQQYFLIGAAIASVALAVMFFTGLGHDSRPPALNGLLQQMRSEPKLWMHTEADVSILMTDMRQNRVAGVTLGQSGIFVSTKDGQKYSVADRDGKVSGMVLAQYRQDQTDAFPLAVNASGVGGSYDWRADIGLALIVLLFAGIGIQAFRMSGGGFKFARKGPQVTFDDVIGAREAKAALLDIMTYLRDPKGFVALGARPPKGVLLSGPPGTGKTQLAKALAGECKVNFIPASGGDFTAMFLGLGSMRVKSLFKKARKNAPCIVFIDEIDGVGRRTTTEGGGPAEAEGNRIINEILTQMDGFNPASGVIVIGATNFPDAVDLALLREGRFDRKIHVKLPDVADREALFRLYAGKVKAAELIDFPRFARLTTGLAPAAIAYIVNHAALITMRRQESEVSTDHFLEAIETCRMGEINGAATAMTEAERERVAVHEAGHAVMAEVLGVGLVEKVTILPRGGALGVTLVTQTEDRQLHLKSDLEKRIQMLLGGRAAELIRYQDASSGAASDLKEASRIALSMVANLGLGDKGSLFSLDALVSLNIRPDPSGAIAEAEQLLAAQNARCMAVLEEYGSALRGITAKLLDRETIDGDEVVQAVASVRQMIEAGHRERRRVHSSMRI